MDISRKVDEGMVVAKRKNKFIRCHRYAKPVGVYTRGGMRKTWRLDDTMEVTNFPPGVVVYGPMKVRVKI